MRFRLSAAPSALKIVISIYPDLTVGPIHCRPFGPRAYPHIPILKISRQMYKFQAPASKSARRVADPALEFIHFCQRAADDACPNRGATRRDQRRRRASYQPGATPQEMIKREKRAISPFHSCFVTTILEPCHRSDHLQLKGPFPMPFHASQ